MAESIRVVCRFRGNESDLQAEHSLRWQFSPNEKSVSAPPCFAQTKVGMQGGMDKEGATNFTFDHVLDASCAQEKMYRFCAQETIHQFMKGYNGTIFAYGQSGSGKTFTMLGPDEVVDVIKKGMTDKNIVVPIETQALYGIIPRAIYEIFMDINKEIEIHNSQFEIKINYFEIYQESLNNLLATNPSQMQGLKLREQKNGSILVLNCDPIYVTNPEDLFDLLMIGQRSRSIASTNQNERSSRSHTILVLEYVQKNPDGSMKQAKLNLVDLAGSERIAKTGATGKTLEEAKKINLSLTTLGQCIKSLTEGKTHIPFRDSKLTFFLKESLGGNSKTTLVCTASQKIVHLEESVQTLKFAQRAKKIKNKAVSNVMKSPKEMEELIAKLKSEVMQLKKQLSEHGINPQVSSKIVEEEQNSSLEIVVTEKKKKHGHSLEDNDESTIMPSQSLIEDDKDGLELDILSELKTDKEWSQLGRKRKGTRELEQMGEDLNLKLTELQTEYEHYKEYADTRIMELEDQVERMNGQSDSKEELQSQIQGFKFILQDKDDESKKFRKIAEKEKAQMLAQIQQMENQVQAKDIVIKELETENDGLRVKAEKAGFEIFCKIKEEIQNDHLSAVQLSKERSGAILEALEKEVGDMEGQYSAQEETILRLKEQNKKLKVRIKQMQFFGQQEQNQETVQVYSSYSHTEIMSVHSGNEESQEQPSSSSHPQPPEEEKKDPHKELKAPRKDSLKDPQKEKKKEEQRKAEEDQEERDSIKAIREKMKKAASHRRNSSFQEVTLSKLHTFQEPAQPKLEKTGSRGDQRKEERKGECKSNRQMSARDGSHRSGSTYKRHGSTFMSKTTIGYQKGNQNQLLKLTMDNIKLVLTNAKLLSLVKEGLFTEDQDHSKQADQISQLLEQVSSLEGQLKEKQFQILYLEKLASAREAKEAEEESRARGGKIQKLEQELVQLRLEHQQTKNKHIDLEEEVRQLKKLNEDMKREKNLYKLDSAKVIRNSVNQLMQKQTSNHSGRFRGGIFGGSGAKDIITRKVEFNEDILSKKIFDEVKPKRFGRLDQKSKKSREPSEYLRGQLLGGPKGKQQNLLKQSFEVMNKSITIDVNSSLTDNLFSGMKRMSGKNSPQSKKSRAGMPLLGQFVGNPQNNIYQQIMQENPIYDGLVKTLHGQQDNLRELNDMLNDSEDSGEDQ